MVYVRLLNGLCKTGICPVVIIALTIVNGYLPMFCGKCDRCKFVIPL